MSIGLGFGLRFQMFTKRPKPRPMLIKGEYLFSTIF
jgi:hypothetical protein